MKLSTNIIKSMAVGDMVDYLTQYSTGRDFKNYTDADQEKYWEYIRKMQEKILKEL